MSLLQLMTVGRKRAPALEWNADQAEAIRKINAFIADEGAREIGIFGAAGTGKTSVVGFALANVRQRVAFCAPTHKAAGILASKAPPWIPCYTVHKILGCKKRYDEENGEILFLPDPSSSLIDQYDVIVIDECSMIGETIHGWIIEAAARTGVKIVWLGDPYQLPPVKDGLKAPAFGVKRYHELTVIMRHTGIIQTLCDEVREAIIARTPAPVVTRDRVGYDGHGEIKRYPNSEEGIAAFLGYYMEDPKTAKALAFKNDDVDFLNGYLRRMIYGDEADTPFLVGERLVLVDTYESPTVGGVYHSGAELTLHEAEQTIEKGLKCWRLQVETDYGAEFEAFAFGSKAEHVAGARMIGRLRQDGKDGLGWRPYFDAVETFARVRPGYATTIHKSQGSTYDRVFILQSELLTLTWDRDLLSRLLYVAFSRARREICVV